MKLKLKQILLSVLVISLAIFNMTAFADQNAMNSNNMNNSNNATTNVYTEGNQNITVNATQPQFSIKLKSNPSTGYTWFLRAYDESIVLPLKHVYQAADSKLIGAPGYELWDFRIKSSGFNASKQTDITFVYARPWKSTDGAKKMIFHVIMK